MVLLSVEAAGNKHVLWTVPQIQTRDWACVRIHSAHVSLRTEVVHFNLQW